MPCRSDGLPPHSRPHGAGTNGRPCLWVIRCYVMTGPLGAVRRRPPIPLIGPAWERRTPADDLFHEPEAQPETVATGAPPKATVSDRHPSPLDTSSDTSRYRGHAGTADSGHA